MRGVLVAYRSLFKRPAFFCAVVFTLTLGIGAVSSIFSVVDSVLLKPLPYPGGDRLMVLFESNHRLRLAHADPAPIRIEDWNRMNHSFAAISGAYIENIAEVSGDLPEMLVGARVSPRFFGVLGTAPLLGRTFSPEEDLLDGPNSVVLSERLWRKRFGSDPGVIGKAIRTASSTYPIVGVMPDSVRFPASNVDFWIPAKLRPVVMRMRDARWESAIGRLKEGASMESARGDLAAVQAQLGAQFPATDANWSPLVEALKEETVGGVRRSLWILFGAVSFVLLIACANVACLLLAQAHRREREIAVRFSLGARRGQAIRELLLEALCLAIPGCLLGLAVSFAATSVFRRAAAVLPRAVEIHLDWRIVVFTLSLSLVTALLFGLIPALRSTRGEVAGLLSQASRTQTGRNPIQRMLVSVQMALAVVLLVGSGLLIRSLMRLTHSSLGFDPEHVLAFQISAGFGEQSDTPAMRQRLNRTLETLRSIPGVASAAISVDLPGGGRPYPAEFHIAGKDSEGAKIFADEESVTADFFSLLGIRILAGNTCRAGIDPKEQPVVLVSRSFAGRYFPGENPIGRYIRDTEYPRHLQVAGVVSDIRQQGYAHDPRPTVYWCGIPYYPVPQFLLRTSAGLARDPLLLSEAVRKSVHAIDPNRAVFGVRRLSDYAASTLTERRFQLILLVAFAATALLLAAVGLYGVASFLVSLRTREIGLRTALGATPSQIFALILGEGAVMVGAGVVAGLVLAAWLSESMASLLFGVAPRDAATFVVVPLLLVCVAALALCVPASRATNIDSMQALRQD